MRHGAAWWRSWPGTSRRRPRPLGARPPAHAPLRSDNGHAPPDSASWAGTRLVGVGVARSIRSVISPWRRARSLGGCPHRASSIARALGLGRSIGRSGWRVVVVDHHPWFLYRPRPRDTRGGQGMTLADY